MAKQTVEYICSSCGHKTQRWQGRCPGCESWNTLEERRSAAAGPLGARNAKPATVVDLSELAGGQADRFSSGIAELDAVIGGGFVPGSLVLLGGDPGIGKSTLALQVCLAAGGDVLYVSGEESAQQVKLRAARVSSTHPLPVLAETDLATVLSTLEQEAPRLVVLDSIQTLYSDQLSGVAGGVAQVTGAVQAVMRLCKQQHIAALIIGHVTKDGQLAGPKTLEHMVDTVLYLEGERFATFRILRCVKNRFGPTNEVGVFEMTGGGMREVKNPSELFLEDAGPRASGSIVTAVTEGSRALLVEVQALTSPAAYGYPRRTAAGFDANRLQLLTAILGKRGGLNLSQLDLYINVAGGLKVTEPAADLAVAMAIVSSIKDHPMPDTVAVGELGLSGEVRFVPNIDKRLNEAKKLGFKRALCPKVRGAAPKGIEVVEVRTLVDALKQL